MAEILGTGKQRAAKASRVGINNGSQYLNWASWDCTIKGDNQDTGNFGSFVASPGGGWPDNQAFDEGITCFVGASGGFGGLWDAGVNPQDDPPGIFPRDDLPDVDLVINRTDGTTQSFPYMRILSAKTDSRVKGLVGFDASWQSQGQFSMSVTSM